MSKYVKGDVTPVVPRKLRPIFFMLVACFALWGLLNNMTDNLVPAFETIFGIKPSESAGVQIAFYGAYAVLAIFAAMMVEEFSYRTGVLAGLGFYILGALIYIPACIAQSFDLYLLGIFILAGGLSILETSCNPYVLSLGPEKTAVRRLNFAQAFNPVGSLAGIFLAKYVILANLKGNSQAVQLFWVCVPYVGLIAVAAVIWFFFIRQKDQDSEYESKDEIPVKEEITTAKSTKAKMGLVGLYALCITIPVTLVVLINSFYVAPMVTEAQTQADAEMAKVAPIILSVKDKTTGQNFTDKINEAKLGNVSTLVEQRMSTATVTDADITEELDLKGQALHIEIDKAITVNRPKDDATPEEITEAIQGQEKAVISVLDKYTTKKVSGKDVSIWGNMVFQLIIVMVGPFLFTLVLRDYREMLIDLLKLPRYWMGVVAQFFYVGVQIAAWTWLNKYCCLQLGLESDVAATYYLISLILFIACRWVSTYYMKKFNPAAMMSLFALVAIACCLGTMYLPSDVLFCIGGLPFSANIICLILISGGMSLMFPTIYGIALGGLNQKIVKLGAAGLIMAILGGAVITPWMGSIIESADSIWLSLIPQADTTWNYVWSTSDQAVRASFIVPTICFAVVLAYSLIFRKPTTTSDK